MSIYENNLSALSKVDETLANELRSITTNELFEVYLPEGESVDNVNIIDNRDFTPIHIENTEITRKLEEYVEFDNYHSLYFFGIGTGVLFQKLLENPNHKKIYIFEPEIELIYIVLNLIDISQDIELKRIIIKKSTTLDYVAMKYLVDKYSSLYLKKYNLDIYSPYYDKYLDEIKRVNDLVLLHFKHVLQDKGDSIEDTLLGLKHSANNMQAMFEAPSLSQITDTLRGRKNAVMVATGPSLQKQLPLLKKYQDYLTILCIDASFPILAKNGIKPDIVLSMERVTESSKFYVDTPKEFHKDVNFLFASVCHEDTFNAIADGEVVIPFLRADRQNIALDLKEWGYLGGGLSSANYLYNFAMNVNFENIVFIGQDLAYGKDGTSHSKGAVYGDNEIKIDDEKFAGYIKAYGGEGEVATMKYWKIFLNDLVVQISASKQYSTMDTYNATEGGAFIDGTIEIPFEKYCDEILDKSKIKDKINLTYPTKERSQEAIKNYLAKQNNTLKYARSVNKQAEKAFKSVEKFLGKIQHYSLEELENKLKAKDIEEQLSKIYQVRGKYANELFLDTFNSLLDSYLSYIDFELAAIKTMRENTPQAIKHKKINYIKINYEWLYRLFTSLTEILRILDDSIRRIKY